MKRGHSAMSPSLANRSMIRQKSKGRNILHQCIVFPSGITLDLFFGLAGPVEKGDDSDGEPELPPLTGGATFETEEQPQE